MECLVRPRPTRQPLLSFFDHKFGFDNFISFIVSSIPEYFTIFYILFFIFENFLHKILIFSEKTCTLQVKWNVKVVKSVEIFENLVFRLQK